MKRILLIVCLLAVVGGGAAYYYRFAGSPEVKRDRALKRAREYINQAKLNEAVIEYKNALKADPSSANSHYELAMALIKRGDHRSAYQELLRATDLQPGLMAARFQLATLQLMNRDMKSAKEQLEKLREQNKDSKEARYLAAQIAVIEKQPDKAIQELEQLLNKEPEQASIYADIGQVYASKGDYRAGEAAFRKAVEIDPRFSRARLALAQLYIAIGDEEKAEQEVIFATEADPENEELLHVVLGNFSSNTHRIDNLEKLYQDLLKKKPDSLIAKKRLTEIYITKNDLNKAWQYTGEIFKAQPGDTDAMFFTGRLYLAQNDMEKAIELLSAVTRNAPSFAPGFYFLGQARVRQNRIDEAKQNISKAIELAPNWLQPHLSLAQLYIATGDVNLALEETDIVLTLQPDNEHGLLLSGAARLKKGETDKALELFKQAQGVNSKNPAAHLDVGVIYVLQKKYPEAIKEYEEALKLAPDQIDALNSIAQIYMIQGNPKAALERAQQQLERTNSQAEIYQLLGQISLRTKDYTKGIAYLQRALGLNPNLGFTYYLIGNAYAAENKIDAAVSQYEAAIKKDPKDIPSYMMLGMLHDFRKQPAKANEYYQKVLEMNKNFASAANNLAWNYTEHGGNLDIALSLAQKAREASPGDPRIADTLGWIYYKKGIYASAVGLLKESNEKFRGSNPTVLYHLALAHQKNGEKGLAQDALKKALTIDQDFPEAKEAKKSLDEAEK